MQKVIDDGCIIDKVDVRKLFWQAYMEAVHDNGEQYCIWMITFETEFS